MKNTFLFLAIVLLIAPACKWKNTKSALKHGEALKSSIESFEKNRQKLSAKLVTSLEDAQVELTSEKPDLVEVSKDFEKEWTKLDELSGSIKKESLRDQELAKNQELRLKWDKSYKEASVSIDKVTQVLEAGNDFHMVLVASSIRQKLEQNVEELNVIADQAKALLGDLEAFTLAGRELVEG